MDQTVPNQAERFLELLRPIQRELEIYCRRLVWASDEAPDTLQNAVLRAFAAFSRYRPEASFRAWMFKILTREAFAMNRKHARIAHYEFQLEPEELAALTSEPPLRQTEPQSVSAEALSESLEPVLSAALKTLTDTERAVLLLRSIGELRYREIAEALDIPLGSVMGNLSRARVKMRAVLGRAARRSQALKENDL
ncbi:MAG TPA: RNA polymerase sigma factor [Verrucomicrobiae bacterium]|nr:RNA polymerase sigma factor [Verrucomicrobiae bacterium]